jgi:hypothetical protein
MNEDEEEAAIEARYCACSEFTPGPDTCAEVGLPLCAACKLWRPEYIKCVATERNPGANKSACGRSIHSSDFSFVDWAHADACEARGGRLLTCKACKAARTVARSVQANPINISEYKRRLRAAHDEMHLRPVVLDMETRRPTADEFQRATQVLKCHGIELGADATLSWESANHGWEIR